MPDSPVWHFLASPGTVMVNVTWMKREFNACQTHSSMYTSIFNSFQVIQPVCSKVRHFSTFFAHFGLPWVRPWDNHGKCSWMERGFNAGQMHSSTYPSIFNRLWAIRDIGHIATFPCILGWSPWTIFVIFGGWVAWWPGYNMVHKYPQKVKPIE